MVCTLLTGGHDVCKNALLIQLTVREKGGTLNNYERRAYDRVAANSLSDDVATLRAKFDTVWRCRTKSVTRRLLRLK